MLPGESQEPTSVAGLWLARHRLPSRGKSRAELGKNLVGHAGGERAPPCSSSARLALSETKQKEKLKIKSSESSLDIAFER